MAEGTFRRADRRQERGTFRRADGEGKSLGNMGRLLQVQ